MASDLISKIILNFNAKLGMVRWIREVVKVTFELKFIGIEYQAHS